jgi:radical SAM superfamily enzyme YgiQ (UPF0313 family)
MRIHLINPSHIAFGLAVITPRWLYVLAHATPRKWGDPNIVDETLEPLEPETIQAGDIVGIGIHTGNALRGYEVGRLCRERGAYVVYGGIHASLYPDEALERGGAHAAVKGDGDGIWPQVLDDVAAGRHERIYEGGRVTGASLQKARWDLMPRDRYMWASVQTVRGCPKHCSFCSVWRTDGQEPRQRTVDAVVEEIVQLRRMGFRFIALADDNFYPVTLEDLAMARRKEDPSRLHELEGLREERFELMERLAKLPSDTVFFTQITMEAAEDPAFLDAMCNARIRGALIGVEAVTEEGLKDVYKDFNLAGDELVARLRRFGEHGVHLLGSFIFGLPSDRPETFEATAQVAQRAGVAFAQFVMLTPFPGTVDFQRWESEMEQDMAYVDDVPLTRYWLIPAARRPKLYLAHRAMSAEAIRLGTKRAWDRFYSLRSIWQRAGWLRTLRERLLFVLMSKLFRQMYAGTGAATDSARMSRATLWARWLAKPTRYLFTAPPMPDLQVPEA